MVTKAVAVCLAGSDTDSLNCNVLAAGLPGAEKVAVGVVAPVSVTRSGSRGSGLPSPSTCSHRYDRVRFSGSAEPSALSVTVSPALADTGSPPATAVGNSSRSTPMRTMSLPVSPRLSVTVTLKNRSVSTATDGATKVGRTDPSPVMLTVGVIGSPAESTCSHRRLSIVPSSSNEAELSSVTVCPVRMPSWSGPASAVGAEVLVKKVTARVADSVVLRPSETASRK